MPPSPTQQPPLDTSHQLLEHNRRRSGMGPFIGIIIILVLLTFGALYFWGASMNREQEQLPFIPGDSTELGG